MHSLNPFPIGRSREATSNDARRYPYAHKCSLNTHIHFSFLMWFTKRNVYKLMKCIKGTRCELWTANCELWPGTCDLWQGRWVPALVSAHSSGRSRHPSLPPPPPTATAHLQNTRHSHHYHNLNTFRASFKIFMRAKDFQVFARVCALWRCTRLCVCVW